MFCFGQIDLWLEAHVVKCLSWAITQIRVSFRKSENQTQAWGVLALQGPPPTELEVMGAIFVLIYS